jgi:hypothetical protein
VSDIRPVRRVVEMLERHGYRALQDDLHVGTLSFSFAGALAGTRNAHDLVVIVDTIADNSESRIRRQVQALARALDMVESRRSLTLIIVGPNPSDVTLRELSRVCRILTVGTPTGDGADDAIRDILAVLLPLDISTADAGSVDPLTTLRAELSIPSDDQIEPIFSAARVGAKAVEQALRQWLVAALPEEPK